MNTCTDCQTAMPDDAAFCPECGAAAGGDGPALMTLGGLPTIGEESTRGRRAGNGGPVLAPGTRFADRYVVAGQLGAGGMGVVYRAEDELTSRTVALKLIRPERIGGAGEVERLVAEGVTARDIRHPNVVAVYDVGVADGQPFLSMELCEGQSLRAWHRARRAAGEDVPLATAARIVREILAGLDAAHASGVIHRDLKPENVILLQEPSAEAAPLKILDFGIARAVGTSSDSGSGTGLGTPHYMAPEQITSPDLAGPPADLYSLSVLFYELLVDVLPQGHWQPPSGGRSDVPRSIDELIERGLSNRPASRPQTAAEYRNALDSGGLGGMLDDFRERVKERNAWLGDKRKVWSVVGIVLVLAVISAAVEEYGDGGQDGWNDPGQWDEPGRNDDVADEPFVASDIDPDVPREPEPKPDPMEVTSVEDLGGPWYSSSGDQFDLSVSRLGRVTGEGYSFDGQPLSFRGRLRDAELTYTLKSGGMTVAEGAGTWDGGLHITYRVFNSDGSFHHDGVFHIQHPAH